MLQYLASLGQRSSHYLHLQYGLLKLSDNTSSSQTWCTAVNEIKKYKASHTAQDILTSNHLARTLYQTYREKSQTEHPFTLFLRFIGTYLAELFHIAEYLEETYPTPIIFPHETNLFQTSFGETWSISGERKSFPWVGL